MKIEPQSIGKTSLLCTDIDKIQDFFENTLELERVKDPDDVIKFDLGNSELELVPQPEDLEITSISAENEPDLTINISKDIEKIVTMLGTKDIILLKGPVNNFIAGREYQSIYFRDPDNHLIEIRSNDLVELNRHDKHPEKGITQPDLDETI